MRSITRQVLCTVLLAQVLLAAGIISLLLLHERYTRLHALDARLQGRADSLAGAIQDAEDTAANVFVDPREFQAPADDSFAVYGEDGRRISSSPRFDARLLALTGAKGFRNEQSGGASYRVKEQPGLRIIDRAETNGVGVQRPITIVYATPQTFVQHELAEATRFYVTAGVLTTAIVALLLTWVLRRSLRPISELAAAAAKIQAPPAMHFVPPASVVQVRELAVLASSLDAVVERLQRAFQKEQRFLSDAAHELKTAVAVAQSGLQVLLIRPRDRDEYIAGVNRALEDTARLEVVVMQMLQSAEIGETRADQGRCDLFAVAERAVTKLAPLSERCQVPVQTAGHAGATAPLSEARALLLIENLLSNALQHSPAFAQVTVNARLDEGSAVLTVSDQGEGIRPESLPRVFERFYREDASRSRKTGGTGLGLAICKAIVDSAGGTIALESEPGRGTTARVIFTAV